MAKCSFCGDVIKPATGILFVRRDGTAYYFCSSKCKLNQLKLHRNPLRVKWTAAYHKEKEAAKAGKKKLPGKKVERKETKAGKTQARRERRKARKAKQRKLRAKRAKKRGVRK